MPTSLNKYLDHAGLDESVLNIRQIAEGLEAEMQALPYARPDGLYPDMTVGAVIGADETAQWVQRESTGSGAATVRSVQGATVGWNQLNNNALYTGTTSGVTFTNNGDGSWTLSGTATDNANKILSVISCPADHKLLVKGCIGGSASTYYMGIGGSITDVGSGGIVTSGATNNLRVDFKSGVDFGDGVTIWPQLFDLTALYGDGNEPTTVAEFERMYPAAYYPYSAPTLKPVQIAGIESTDAQGGELDAIEWTAQTLRAAGSVRDELTADELVTRVGVVDLGTLNWSYSTFGNGSDRRNLFYAAAPQDIANAVSSNAAENIFCGPYDTVANSQAGVTDKTISYGAYWILGKNVYVCDLNYGTDAAAFKAAMNGVLLYYELATPTTQLISPSLPMTYRVQQGGSESVIVPDGEVSAAPVLTIAEPVNMSTELARIWEAIQSLGYTRNAAQLSRPVSLTDIGSIDEVQKDTTEIDTTKEVQE